MSTTKPKFTRLALSVAVIVSSLPLQSMPQTKPNPPCDPGAINGELVSLRQDEGEYEQYVDSADFKYLRRPLEKLMKDNPTYFPWSESEKERYWKSIQNYDLALEKYNENLTNGMDDAKARANAKLQSAETGWNKARDEILRVLREEIADWKGKKELEDLPGEPKHESPPERLRRLESEFLREERAHKEAREALPDHKAELQKTRARIETLVKKLNECKATCLVGTWRSESVTDRDGKTRGGSGIILTVRADGKYSIRYDDMQPYQVDLKGVTETVVWKGTVTAYEGDDPRNQTDKDVLASDKWLTRTTTIADNPPYETFERGDGPAAPFRRNKCDGTTLTVEGDITIRFKRQQ